MRNMILAFAVLTITAGTAAADCTSEVNDAFAKLRKSAAFRMETKITNPQGTLTMSNDYVLPDRMHQTVSMGGDGPQAMQMILVGGKAWSNQGNAGWAEVPEKFATVYADTGFVLGVVGTRYTVVQNVTAFRAIDPAILNAISDESTSWKEPSKSVALTSTIGYPA